MRGCHNLIDPIGFGFEKFDAIGMRREKAQAAVLSESNEASPRGGRSPSKWSWNWTPRGRWRGSPNSEFTSPRQLGEMLARTPQCQECVVKQVFRYHVRPPGGYPADRPVLNQALDAFRASGFRFKELIVALVKLREIRDITEAEMSQVITKRVRLSRESS